MSATSGLPRAARTLLPLALVLVTAAGALAATTPATKAKSATTTKAGSASPAARAKAGARRMPARPTPPEWPLYQELLNDHLWTTSEPGEPLETRFNYEKFYDEPGRAERCWRIRSQFLSVDPAKLDERHRLAWAIDFYNYLVIEQITDHLLIPNKKRQRWTTVPDIKLDGEGLFEHPLVRIDTTTYSLQAFADHFVFAGYDRKSGGPPPKSLDPRAHFALVDGAVGSPPLQQRAYRSDSLDLQLDRAVRASLASPHHWNPVAGARAVQLSAIFFRYAPDFGGASHLVAWALPYVAKDRRGELAANSTVPAATSQILWDWRINQVTGWHYYDQMSQRPPGVPHDST